MEEEEEEPWIEDDDSTSDDNKDSDDSDNNEQNFGADMFNTDKRDPDDEFDLEFGPVKIKLSGIKARFPHLLQSTGLTLWKGSESLCEYLCDHPESVRGKWVVELGAGLGLCGIVAHKLGAAKVILTDGDTDTLKNMRRNIASNSAIGGSDQDKEGSIVCKQLLWGRNVETFRERWAAPPGQGFDVVMGGDIVYAQESLEPLFETVLLLLSARPGSLFLLSFVFRDGVTIDSVLAYAKRNGLRWSAPDQSEGVYVFSRQESR